MHVASSSDIEAKASSAEEHHSSVCLQQEPDRKEPKPNQEDEIAGLAKAQDGTRAALLVPPTIACDSALSGHVHSLDPGQIRALFMLWKVLLDLELSHAFFDASHAQPCDEWSAFDLEYEQREKKKCRSALWSPWKVGAQYRRRRSLSSSTSLGGTKAGKADSRQRASKACGASTSEHVFHSLQFGIASLPLADPFCRGPKESPTHVPRTSFSEELWRGFLFRADPDADSSLLRFLRARNWDLERAGAMLSQAIEWRARNAVFELLRQGESLVAYSIWSSGKFYFHSVDLSGRPVMYAEIRKHHPKEQSYLDSQVCMLYNMELSRRFLRLSSQARSSSACTRAQGDLSLTSMSEMMETMTIVFNMRGFTMSNMDLPAIKFLIHCLQNYYPETLGRCYIVAAPGIFWIVWKMIRPWLDPIVASKVFFIKIEDMGRYIDAKDRPKDYEGENDVEFVYDLPESSVDCRRECEPEPQPNKSDAQQVADAQQKAIAAASASSIDLSQSSMLKEKAPGECFSQLSLDEGPVVVASDRPELTRLQQEFYTARSEFVRLTRMAATTLAPIADDAAIAAAIASLDAVIQRRKELKSLLHDLSLALDELTVPGNYYHRKGLFRPTA